MADKNFSMAFLLGAKLASSFSSTFKKAQTSMTKLRDASEQMNAISGKMVGGVAAIGGGFAAAAGGVGLFITSVNGANSEMANMSKAMGVSLDSTRLYGGLMESIGGNWENYTDLIEEMTNKMGELNATGEMKKLQEALGYSNLEFAKMQKMKPQEQFESIMDVLLKMPDAQKAAFISDEIFGGEGNKMVSVARLQAKSVEELYANFNKYNLYTKEAQKQTEDFNNAMKPMGQLADSAKSQFAALLGGALTPLIKQTTEWVSANKELVNQKMADFAQSFADSLEWIATNFDKILLVIKAIGAGIAIFSTFSAVIKTITIVSGIWNAVMLANPIVLVAVAIAGLAAGLYYLIDKMGGVSAVWEKVKLAFSSGVDFIKSIIQKVDSFFAENPILNFLFPIIGIPRMIIANWDVISGFFSGLWDSVTTYTSTAITAITSAVMNMPIVQAFKTVWNNVITFLSTLGSTMLNLGKNIIDGLVDGIMAGFDKLKEIWNKINSYIPDFARKKMDIHSPSRVMAGIGGYITEGLGVGIQSGFPSVQNAMNGGLNSIMPNPSGGIASPSTNNSTSSYTITLNLTGNGNIADQAKQGTIDAIKQLEQAKRREQRVSFA